MSSLVGASTDGVNKYSLKKILDKNKTKTVRKAGLELFENLKQFGPITYLTASPTFDVWLTAGPFAYGLIPMHDLSSEHWQGYKTVYLGY